MASCAKGTLLVSKLSPPRSLTAAALRTAAAAAATSHVCAARHDNVHRSTESRRRHHQNDFSLGIPRIASSARCYPSLYSARSARVHTHTHPPPWLHCASRALTQWGAGGRMDEQSSYQRRAGRGLRLLEGDWPLRGGGRPSQRCHSVSCARGDQLTVRAPNPTTRGAAPPRFVSQDETERELCCGLALRISVVSESTPCVKNGIVSRRSRLGGFAGRAEAQP